MGVCFVTKCVSFALFCFLQKDNVLLGIYLNTLKYNVCSIKLEKKV